MSDDKLFSCNCRGDVLGGATGLFSFALAGHFPEVTLSSSEDTCDVATE